MPSITTAHIETERLLLRKLTPEVYEIVFTSYSDEEICMFFGLRTNEELAVEKDKYKNGLTTYNKSFLYFQLIEKSSGKIIGGCGYHTWYLTHSRAEIGYALNADEQKGKGLMKEALAPVIQYGFEDMQLQRIEACIGPANIASLKLVQHFGFTREGLLREHYFKNGKLEDSFIFSLLKSEYKMP